LTVAKLLCGRLLTAAAQVDRQQHARSKLFLDYDEDFKKRLVLTVDSSLPQAGLFSTQAFNFNSGYVIY
jgi:hypothetical protein